MNVVKQLKEKTCLTIEELATALREQGFKDEEIEHEIENLKSLGLITETEKDGQKVYCLAEDSNEQSKDEQSDSGKKRKKKSKKAKKVSEPEESEADEKQGSIEPETTSPSEDANKVSQPESAEPSEPKEETEETGNEPEVARQFPLEDEEKDEVHVEGQSEVPAGKRALQLAKALRVMEEKLPEIFRKLKAEGQRGFALMPEIEIRGEIVLLKIWFLKKVDEDRFVPHPKPIAIFKIQ